MNPKLYLKDFKYRTFFENKYCTSILHDCDFFERSYNNMVQDAKEMGVKAKDYPDYLMDCSKYLHYQKYEKGDYIFHKGDIGNKMYVILEGNVSIFVPKS